MGRKSRRGSSTRKYKLHPDQPKLPFKKQKEEAATTVATPGKQQRMIDKLTSQLRLGRDEKGNALKDEDITKKLTLISTLENRLGIIHRE